MDLVEYDGVDEVHAYCGGEEVGAEDGLDVEGDGKDKGSEQVEKGFIDLLLRVLD